MRKHTVNSICSYREGEDALVKIHVARPSSSGLACQLTSTKANIETDFHWHVQYLGNTREKALNYAQEQ